MPSFMTYVSKNHTYVMNPQSSSAIGKYKIAVMLNDGRMTETFTFTVMVSAAVSTATISNASSSSSSASSNATTTAAAATIAQLLINNPSLAPLDNEEYMDRPPSDYD